MVFIETNTFRLSAAKLLDEDDLAALQTVLMLHPDAGSIIPGSGGLRKVRVPAKGKGKRAGARLIYYWVQADGQILLLYAYAKNDRSDVTAKQIRAMRKLIEE